MPVKVRIWWDRDIQGYHIESPYNPQLVNGLKSIIPASDRAYDPVTKIWTFSERWFSPVKTVCDRLYGNQVSYLTRESTERATAPAVIKHKSLDEVLLAFSRLLPNNALRKAYLVAATELHPDRGGNMEKMAELNALWARIEEERKI